MEAVRNMNKWANRHTNIGFDLLRIALGVFLFIKGIQFMSQTEYLVNLIRPDDPNFVTMLIAHYIAMSHFAGGILIAFGLITRLSILIQLPVLIGAVWVNLSGHVDAIPLIESVVALVVAGFFLFYGSGKHSIDYTLKVHM